MSANFVMWVIYEHPKDFPEEYVARQWQIYPGTVVPGKTVERDQDLHVLRQRFDDMGLVCAQPSPGDDPAILEIWF